MVRPRGVRVRATLLPLRGEKVVGEAGRMRASREERRDATTFHRPQSRAPARMRRDAHGCGERCGAAARSALADANFADRRRSATSSSTSSASSAVSSSKSTARSMRKARATRARCVAAREGFRDLRVLEPPNPHANARTSRDDPRAMWSAMVKTSAQLPLCPCGRGWARARRKAHAAKGLRADPSSGRAARPPSPARGEGR